MATKSILLAAMLAMALPAFANNNNSAERGRQVAERAAQSDEGFGDSKVIVNMILRDDSGNLATRKLKLWSLEVPAKNAGDKSLLLFSEPKDIRGTALLNHAGILEPDSQWLYLPAMKRIKRISTRSKSGAFVGSEFAFEDFTALELEKFDYRWLRVERCGEFQCNVIERRPRYKRSGYSRQLAWYDQKVNQLRKVEFYDLGNSHRKTLLFTDYRQYQGKFWRAHKLNMENHVTGKGTDMLYEDFRFKTGLSERDFVKSALKKAR